MPEIKNKTNDYLPIIDLINQYLNNERTRDSFCLGMIVDIKNLPDKKMEKLQQACINYLDDNNERSRIKTWYRIIWLISFIEVKYQYKVLIEEIKSDFVKKPKYKKMDRQKNPSNNLLANN